MKILILTLDNLITETETIATVRAQEDDRFQAQSQEVEALLKHIQSVRESHSHLKSAWKDESKDLYSDLKDSTDSYNLTEQEYQAHRQEIRMEMHDDSNLINDLENSLKEGNNILGSLKDKAKFSNKLEAERSRMITDRALLLKDLCKSERLNYKKNLKTLPAFIEVPHQKGKALD